MMDTWTKGKSRWSSLAGSGMREVLAAGIRARTRVFTLFLSSEIAGE
jgi:hypothetical protein